MMKPLFVIAKIVVQMLVALFAVDSLVTHFNFQHSEYSEYDTQPGTGYQHEHTSNHDLESTSTPVVKPSAKAVPYTTLSYTIPNNQVEHYIFKRNDGTSPPPESVIFLTVTKDGDSWGRNPTEAPRTIYHYFDLISNNTLDPSAVSVGLLTSSKDEFEAYKGAFESFLRSHPFNRVTLVNHPGIKHEVLPSEGGEDIRDDRHDNSAQHERRSTIAKLRNYLMSATLQEESHLLWLDADVYQFSSPDMVEAMMKATANAVRTGGKDVGVLTARCRIGEPWKAEAWEAAHPYKLPLHSHSHEGSENSEETTNSSDESKPTEDDDKPKSYEEWLEQKNMKENEQWKKVWGHYDLNSWAGPRRIPTEEELDRMWRDRTAWNPENVPATKPLEFLLRETKNDDLVPLDSVGGTVLMMRADLVRMGLNFATGYFVGMSWEHGEGWDGIETEGVCLLSRSLSRDGQSMCYALGGDWAVWHTVY